MSLDFTPKRILDSRLDLVDKREFPVYQSAANITPQIFASSTNSVNNVTYTIQVPSLENVLDMVVLARSTVSVAITGSPAAGDYLFCVDALNGANQNTGNACLNAFPYHQLMTTANIVINQCSFGVDMQNVLPSMLRMISREQLEEFNHMCPTQLDNVNSYAQAGYLTTNASPFNTWYQSTSYKNESRAGWKIDSITGNNAVGDGSARAVVVTYTTVEPLLISPFSWGRSPATQGIQSINLNINLDSSASRYLKFALPLASRIVALSSITSDLQVVFMAPKASQLASFSPRNVLNFYKLDRYVSTQTALTATGGTFSSPSIQLSSIPKAALVTIRPIATNTIGGTSNTPEWFLPITKANVMFNTESGLLSSCSQYQLYKMSCETGVQMSFSEWSGTAQGSFNGSTAPGALATSQIKTIGSVLALSFGPHIQISQEYSAPSSLGQWNLQINCDYGPSTYTGLFEMCLVLVNEGVVSTSRGNTQSFVNLLSKETVMSVIGDKPVYDAPTQSVTDSVDEVLEGGRRRKSYGMGKSGGGMSGGKYGGKSRLSSRLM